MTTNYCARTFGVRSGVPGFIGRKLCKNLLFMKPNYQKYRAASEEFHSVLRKYDNELEAVGLDEANLDVTDYLIENNMNHEMGKKFLAESIRREIKERTQMTASCGIACNKMLAKICSDMKKPNGQTYLDFTEQAVEGLIGPLPVRKIPGVGKINEQILLGMDIKNCDDALDKAVNVYVNFTENAFDFLMRACMGIAKNIHEDGGLKKSLNVSETFPMISGYKEMKDKIIEMSTNLYQRCRDQKLSGRTLTVEFKNEKFKNMSKSWTQNGFISTQETMTNLALQLFETCWPLEPVRQIQIKLINLKDDTGRLSATAMDVLAETGGKTKLAGKANIQPCPIPGAAIAKLKE